MTARDRRVLASGLAVVLSAVVLLRLVPAAVRAERNLREQVRQQASTVGRLEAGLGELPALEDSAKTLQAALQGLAPRLISGTSRADGQGELSVLLRSLAEGLGAKVERIVPVADSVTIGSLARISVRFEGESDARGIARLLGVLSRHPTVLEVVSLRIMATEPSSPGTVAERIRIEAVIRGWLLTSQQSHVNGAGT